MSRNSILNPSFVLIILLTIASLFCGTTNSSAAKRYWVAAISDNWNNTANWSTTSGGPGGASVPGSSDYAYFNGNGNGSCSINVAVNIYGINISNYAGAIYQTSTNTITVGSGDWIQSGGTFSGGSAYIDINDEFELSGGLFVSTGGTLYLAGNWTHNSGGTFTHNGGTVEFNGDYNKTFNVNSTETFYNLTFNKSNANMGIASNDIAVITGTLSLSNGFVNYISTPAYLDARGNVSVSSGFDGGSEPLRFTGSASVQTFSNSGTDRFDADITINKSAGEVQLNSNFTLNGEGQDLILTSGTLNVNGKTLTINRSSYTNTLTVNGSATISGSGSIITHDYVQTTGTLTVSGNATLSTYDDFTLSGGVFNWGSNWVDVDDDFTISGGTFNAPSSTLYIGGSWYHTSGGTFTHNSGLVYFNNNQVENINVASSETFYDLTIDKINVVLKVGSGDILIISRTLTLTNGFVNFTSTPGYLDARGNVSIGSGFDGGSEPLHFTGTASEQTFNINPSAAFHADITINKSAGEVKLISNMTLNGESQDLYITSGTLNVNTKTLVIHRSTHVNTLTVNGTGNIKNEGSITAYQYIQTGGTLTYTGTADATLTIHDDFTLNGGTFTAGSGYVDVNDNLTISNGIFNAPSTILYVEGNFTVNSNGTFNPNNGTVSFDGDQHSYLDIYSSETFYNMTVDKISSSYNFYIYTGDVAICSNTLTLNNGFMMAYNGSAIIRALGNVNVGSSFDGGYPTITLEFTGSANQDFNLTGATSCLDADIKINKSGGEVNLLSSLTMNAQNQDLYLQSGTFNLNANAVNVNYNNSTGTLYALTNTSVIAGSGSISAYNYNQSNGTISLSGAATLNFNNDFALSGGTFTGGSGYVNVDNHMTISGGTFNAPSGVLYVEGNFTITSQGAFEPGSGTVYFNGNQHSTLDVYSSETFNNLTVDKYNGSVYLYIMSADIVICTGTLTLNNGFMMGSGGSATLKVQGNVDVEPGFDGGYPTIILEFTGSADQDFDLTGETSALDADILINKSGGEVTLLSTLTMNAQNQDLYMKSGTFNLNGNVLNLNYNNSTGTLYAQTSTSVIGGSGSINAYDYNQSSGTISLSGSATLSFYDDFTLSGGTFTGGSGYVNVDNHMTLSGGTFNAPSATLYIEGNLTVESGATFEPGTGTVSFNADKHSFLNVYNSETFNNLQVNKTNGSYYFYIYSGDIAICTGTLTLSNGFMMAYQGSATIQALGNVDVDYSFDGGYPSITLEFTGAADQNFDLSGATSNLDADIKINKTAGEVTLLSALTMNREDQDLYMQAGTLNLNGQTLSVNYNNGKGTLYAQTGTSVIAGSGSLSAYNYSQSGGAISISGDAELSFVDDFTLSGGTFTGNSGYLNVDDNFILSGGTFTAPSGIFYLEGNFTHSSGTFTHNNGTLYFNGDQHSYVNLPGSTTFYHVTTNKSSYSYFLYIYGTDILITLGTLTLANGGLTGYNGTGTLQAEGNVDVEYSIDVNTTAIILKFCGSAVQSFDLTSATSYLDVDIKVNKSGGQVNLLSNLTMNNSYQDLVIEEGTFDLNGYTLIVSGSNSTLIVENGGNLQMQGGETSTTPTLNSGSTVSYDGTSPSYTIKNWAYDNLTVKGDLSTQFSLPSDMNIPGILTFTSGMISTGSYDLYISTGGSVSRAAGHVIGNFKKYIATGNIIKTFEIGDESNYSPITVDFGNVSGAGDLTATVTDGDHPNIGSASLNSSKSVNRYWTLSNSGISYTNYSATCTFVTEDLDAGTSTSELQLGNYESGNWNYPSIGSRTSTSTQGTGISSFGDFQLAEGPEITWDGGAFTNNWGDANNWNPDGVPTSTANINLNGANTINVNVLGVCNNLTLNNSSLVLTILNGNSLDISGNLTMTDGTFNTAESFPSVNGTVNLAGGTFGYTHTGNQTVAVQNYSSLAISGSGTKTLAGNITTSRNLTLSAATLDLDTYSANRISAGGTLTLSNGTTLKIGGTGTLPSNYSTHSMASTSTVEYDGSVQTVAALNSSQNYGNLVISGSATKCLGGNIGIAGDLTISAATFDLDGYSANRSSLGGTLSLNSGKTLKIGGTAGFPSNFSTHSIHQNSIIEYDGTTQTVDSLNCSGGYGHLTISGTGEKTLGANVSLRKDLTINSGASLEVNPGLFLTVNGTLTLNGSECLVLKTDSTGLTGSLLDDGIIGGSGTVKFQRYFSANKWHYFTPVIQNTNSNSFWNAALYIYNSSASAWQPVGPNVTLTKMQGYDVYYKYSTTVSFVGVPYTGAHSKSLVNTANGYNFVGNPFLSAVDWDASSGWTKNDVNNSSYIWDPDVGGVASYVNGNATNGGSRYIPPSQGFFITVSNNGPYRLGLDNKVRKHKSKKNRSVNMKENSLKIILADEEFADEMIISFTEEATDLFDGENDAYKMKESDPSRTIIYSKTSDGIELSINSFPELRKDKSIPLYLGSGAAGIKEFSIVGLEGFDSEVDIFLEDLKLGLVVDMKIGKYSFIYTPMDEKKRFILHFAVPSVITSNLPEIQESNAGAGPHTINTFISRDELIIDLTKTKSTKTSLYLYNMWGQLIMQKDIFSNEMERIKIKANSGYYLVKLVSDEQIYTKKILKTTPF